MKNIFKSSASVSLTVLLSTLVVAGIVYASTIKLTAPAGSPTATSSTLGDIYIRLTTNATSTAGSHDLTVSTAPADSFYTLAQIYAAIPTIYPTDFLASSTYLGVTGTIAVKTGDTAVVTSATSTNKLLLTPPVGYYNGTATISTTSTAFTATNIRTGINLFGILGTLSSGYTYGDNSAEKVLTTATGFGTYDASNLTVGNVKSSITFGTSSTGTLIQALGNAGTADVLEGKTFSSSTASNVSGTISIKTGNTVAASSSAQGTSLVLTVPQGYYSGASSITVSTSSTNFVASNIATGTNLFGVTGTKYPSKLLQTFGTSDYCYDGSGNIISCAGTGEDGQYQSGQARSYTDNGDLTITDNNTGLMWQKCTNGQSGASCDTGSPTALTFAQAAPTCMTLSLAGHSDWRLPNILELDSLVTYNSSYPAINTIVFPNTPSGGGNIVFYWSSSIYANAPSNAWGVYFSDGDVSGSGETGGSSVRCVRG